MKLIPILTEKSMKDAREGKYTFWVPVKLRKPDIAKLISLAFGVHVTKVRVINYKGERKRKLNKPYTSKARKKAFVELKEKESIAIFGEKKGSKK